MQALQAALELAMETLIRFFLVALMFIVAAGLFLLWASNR